MAWNKRLGYGVNWKLKIGFWPNMTYLLSYPIGGVYLTR
ncbi:MAG: hypothetical protein OFPI_44010 [Osedax symbiont Rs2]|nr:MAG: hypothetical protein OFPI_44010 [Osedax symbiont Rs2]